MCRRPYPKCLPAVYIPNGIEISHELSQVAAQGFGPRGGRVLQADALTGLLQLLRSEYKGGIMTSFLEHDRRARETLIVKMRVMSPGARLIVKVPNYASWNRVIRGAEWCGFRFPDHVNYFTPTTLSRMITDAGFGILRFSQTDHLPTSDTMWLIAEIL